MLYSQLCETYEKLESTSKGLEKTSILAEFLNKLKKEPQTIYLLQGRIFPDYEEKEMGISQQLVIKAISQATGSSEEKITKEFTESGDLGLVAEKLIITKKQSARFSTELTTEKVLANLRKLPEITGKGAVDRKIGLIVELFHSANAKESKYIARTLMGDLKVGIGNGLLRDSIGEALFSPKDIQEKKRISEIVQSAFDKATDFAEVFEKAVKGEKELEKITLSPGKPVKVMLYPKADDIKDAFEIVGKPAAVEFKYDGFRLMINKDEKGDVQLFTRRLDNVTAQFPDVVKYANEYIKADSFIIDCEAVGFDPNTRKYKPFQDISQRIRRKYDIEKLEKELPVELNVFDIIYCNGKSLINEPFIERRKTIERVIKQVLYKIRLAEQIITDDEQTAEAFYNKALEENQEGVMVKNLQAVYKPGARIGYAVKLKPEAEEFDLVITGAEWGTGKRAGWLTSFDVSCRDESTGELLEIGKVSTGLKEKREEGLSFEEMTEILTPLIKTKEGTKVFVKPEIVVSVGYQNIQRSPTYTSGFALRFPRMLRIRPDRGISDIVTLEDIKNESEKGT